MNATCLRQGRFPLICRVLRNVMARINWIPRDEARGDLKDIYDAWFAENPDRSEFPGILQCFTPRPDFLKDVMDFSNHVHFSDGHLTRRTKGMIATYVSGLNQCPY